MRKISRLTPILIMASLLIATPLLWSKQVSAAPLSSRSVRIGSSYPNAINNHTFNFTIDSVSSVGSIEFEYCVNSPFIGDTCTVPVGFSASSATLSAQSGETGFTIDPSSTVNRLVLSRTASLTSLIPVSYTFNNITNQNAPAGSVFVRIATFSSTDGTGGRTDSGAVAFATTNAVSVSGFVPPYLTFCVGVTVAGDCSFASGEQLNFGEFSKNQPKFVTSQFAGATNDPGGYSTFVSGLTMTSGTNIIPALSAPTASSNGASQFGMNLRANTIPGVGSNSSGVGTAMPTPDFNQPNFYKFGNQIITNTTLPTDFNVFTVSYIVNVSQNQSPGVYNTTLTYIATAAF